MSLDLDRQLREYCQYLDDKQGALSFEDIVKRTGQQQVIQGPEVEERSPRSWWIAAAAAVIILVAAVGIRFLPASGVTREPAGQLTTTSIATPTTSTTVAADISEWPPPGPIEAGTYHIAPSTWTVADLTLTMPGGWETQYGSPGAIKGDGQDREVGFHFWIVDAIYTDPCVGSRGPEDLTRVGPSVDDLAAALLAQPFTGATGPADTTIGGVPAKRIDLAIPDGVYTTACNLPLKLQIWHSVPADDYFVLLDDGTASVYIFDVNGERQVLVTQYQDGATAEDLTELQTIVDSINIDA
jgi:hypothetical protein